MRTSACGSCNSVLDDDFRPKKGKLIFGGKRLMWDLSVQGSTASDRSSTGLFSALLAKPAHLITI